MTLNASGPISLAGTTAGQSIEIELGGNGTTQISLNDSSVRTLAGVASGAITMPTNFWGKANRVSISYTFASTTANASLNISSIGGYIAGKSDVTVNVNGGVYLYGTTTGNPGLSVFGGTSGDTLTIVNLGYIMGCGGTGSNSTTGGAGGPGLSLGYSATVNNTNGSAYILGGGGGGGGGSSIGGGGGAGGGGTNGGSATGGPGAAGGNGPNPYTGGGGGRIIPGSATLGPGTGGTAAVAGYGGTAGGGGSSRSTSRYSYGYGGPGQGGQTPGTNGNGSGGGGGGGGGGYGASGGSSGGTLGVAAGGGGGRAVALNGNTVTWVAGNTTRVWGAVS